MWLRVVVGFGLVAGLGMSAAGQTLARPGWVGSGMTVSSWWRHAVVYAIDLPETPGGLKGVVAQMPAMQSLGVDAVLLRGMQHDAVAGADPIDPAVGTMDDFDQVLVAASRQNLRVLIELRPKSASEDISGIARFWLSRGVAGFRLVGSGDSAGQMKELRAAAKGYVGERVMIGDAALSSVTTDAGADSGSGGRHRGGGTVVDPSRPVRVGDGPQLLLDASIAVAPLNVGAIRMALEKNDAMNRAGAGVPMLATAEGAGGGPEFGKVVATLLLSTRGGAMLRAGQEGKDDGPQSLGRWYHDVGVLQHSNATVRTGVNEMLNHDAEGVVAWVRRPEAVSYHTPAVVFLCNMTDKPVTLSLVADMQGLRLKGSFLRTLLRSDAGMGAMSLDAVKLAPYGVYIGELKY
jgi:hypothetical protein